MLTQAADPFFALRIENAVLLGMWAVLLVVKVFALVDALFHRDDAYVAADKQNKAFWLLMLAIFLVLHFFLGDPRHVLNLVGTVAALVYLADVRPTLRAMKQY